MLPNFLIIGAAKAGTTSLWDFLLMHPQVFMPAGIKETHFFAFEGMKPDFRGPGDDEAVNRGAVSDLDTYETLFEGSAGYRAVGEASTSYLYHPAAPGRIRAHVPDVKIIAILRNPVERAFSAYLHHIRDGREPEWDFAAALALEPERIAANWEQLWHYQAMGLYYAQISRYYDTFDKSKIKLYLFEDLVADQRAVLTDMLRFLGLDDTVEIGLKRLNASSHTRVPRIKLTEAAVSREHFVKRAARRLLPAPWVSRARNLLTRRVELTPSVRRTLVGVFRQDIEKLASLIDRDLSSWAAS
ncbi:MAG: sulfotransferase family protein [Isosphaeraceae bacterium]